MRKAEILQNEHVGAEGANVLYNKQGRVKFLIGNEGVEGDMNLNAPCAAVFYSFFKLLRAEVFRVAARVKVPRSKVDRIGTAAHRAQHALKRTCRSKDFSFSVHYAFWD